MKRYLIKYDLMDTPLYYSVELGEFCARGEATKFRHAADAKMVRLRLHEERALSLNKLSLESAA